MTNPFLDDIVVGDVRASLKMMPERFVNTCVTSPPYFGLRNYGTPAQVWGGDAVCHHAWDRKGFCRCGSWRGHLGLEPTPDLFVAHLVEVFRGVKRVLRDDGILWLNLGDSYNQPGSGGHGATGGLDKSTLSSAAPKGMAPTKKAMCPGLKQKDLIGIPWMVAFALRADGWYLRSDIIWEKPNVMPSSVTDRCTTSHEYIFMLTKSAKYHYDGNAIKEKSKNPGQVVKLGERSFAKRQAAGKRMAASGNGLKDSYTVLPTRNKRSVWRVSTKPFKGAHFAAFPPTLIEPCILAGAPRGGVVLDPFMGSGTTGLTAAQHGRHYVGCELNAEYAEMAEARIMGASLEDLV